MPETNTPSYNVCCGNSFHQQFWGTGLTGWLLCVDTLSYTKEEGDLFLSCVLIGDWIAASTDPKAERKTVAFLYLVGLLLFVDVP